ncbi:LysR substrate-binding domain-containing protein [Ferruginivarius sediminum]|uniref:LysR family transcriptional regulator n=1 Tax=Ferruginivarius sediminum TaxID=2661937 RepID=A0A369T5E7_9PROT|nr:LysR substrate-binding domain-containing protein [Ferruginivarius sediminum]RDD60561.1 LysR family transcriptional regulator [Ferruginivarius sediminum]
MTSLRRKLPSPTALVTFEAAARHLNFTRAAAELLVTQAAVSRQIRRLEDDLGIRLFRREWRGLALTADGRFLQRAVAMGLDHIANATDQLRRRHSDRQVTLVANNAVAFLWLQPRTTSYVAAHPQVDLRLVTSDRHLDFMDEGVDLAVRYGDGQWPGVEASLLFEEEVFPVCSPAYLASRPPLDGPGALESERLLQMEQQGPDWVTWANVVRALGAEPTEAAAEGPRFDNFVLLLQAALDGQGMAIGTRHLLDRYLADGHLVRPFPGSLRTGRGYYLALPADVPCAPAVRHLHDWLLGSV